MKRQRGRGRRPNHGNRSFESNGPDIKIRGNASQIHEKYLQYARDAHSSGDRVRSENFFQHAEHYHRLMALSAPREKQADDSGSAPNPPAQEQPGEFNSQRSSSDDSRRGRNQPRRPRPERSERPERSVQPERSERTTRLARPESVDRQAEPPAPGGGARSALDALAEEQATVSES